MCLTAQAVPVWSEGARNMPGNLVVVMGVSGCGKSTVGQLLAGRMGVPFVEGDELHPPANVARMAAGIPLSDEDRLGWLQTIAARLGDAAQRGRGMVVSCSALKRSYRDVLRQGAASVRFVHLHGSADLLQQRMASRPGHYMPPSLLPSQFAILEVPDADEQALSFDATQSPEAIVDAVLQALRADASVPH